jgi:hypothetical protein
MEQLLRGYLMYVEPARSSLMLKSKQNQIRFYSLPFASMRPIRFTDAEKHLPVREGTMLKNDVRMNTAAMVQEGQTLFVWD